MGLVGNFQELGLSEIFLIMRLSRKSGILDLNGKDHSGRVYLKNGFIVYANNSAFPEKIGELLVDAGLVKSDIIDHALFLKLKYAAGRHIGAILVDEFGIDRTFINAVVQEHIERTIFNFFTWTEGAFAFNLSEAHGFHAVRMDPMHFMLEIGLVPKLLALEGRRQRIKQRQLNTNKYVTGVISQEEKEEDNSLCRVLFKKKQKVFSLGSNHSFINDIECGTSISRDQQLINIGDELLREFGEETSPVSCQSRLSPNLYLLRGMLEELNNPSLGSGVILLILRFASELMNRAVIFMVREHEIIGLGQFGVECQGGNADFQVRNLLIPTTAESMFTKLLSSMSPMKVKPVACYWNDYLFERLGGQRPQEVFIGPLVSGGRVIAILYCDNLPDQKPLGDTKSLEIFLSQAGLAMVKALLKKK